MPAEVADGRVIIERTQLQARPRLRMGAQVQQSSGMKLCYDAVQELCRRSVREICIRGFFFSGTSKRTSCGNGGFETAGCESAAVGKVG